MDAIALWQSDADCLDALHHLFCQGGGSEPECRLRAPNANHDAEFLICVPVAVVEKLFDERGTAICLVFECRIDRVRDV